MAEYIKKSKVERMLWAVIMSKDERTIKEILEDAPIVNAISIPNGATNGEVLCTLFPNMHYTLSDKSPRVITTIGVASSFDIDWWNAKYKGAKK